MDIFTILATAAQAMQNQINNAINLGNTAYDIYNNERNYNMQVANLDYQKRVQNIQWMREDTALQRRIADAEKAGINKNAVVGNGASSSVVSTTAPYHDSTQLGQINLGNLLDTMNQVEIYKQQKINTEIAGLSAKNEALNNAIKIQELDMAENDAYIKRLDKEYAQMDFDFDTGKTRIDDKRPYVAEQHLEYQNEQNSAKSLQFETGNQKLDWWLNKITSVANTVINGVRASGGRRSRRR